MSKNIDTDFFVAQKKLTKIQLLELASFLYDRYEADLQNNEWPDTIEELDAQIHWYEEFED